MARPWKYDPMGLSAALSLYDEVKMINTELFSNVPCNLSVSHPRANSRRH